VSRSEPTPLRKWPDVLEAALLPEEQWSSIHVLRETDSTQTAAVRMGVEDGGVTTTWRQRSGRGRRGKSWADTADEGVAMTLTVAQEPSPHLSCAVAIGVIDAIADVANLSAAAKWPNDVLLNTRKVAGILIEVRPGTGLLDIGIGVNVLQEQWEGDLARSAISLLQAGAWCDPVAVLIAVARCVQRALKMSKEDLTARWRRADVLIGRNVSIHSSGKETTGLVVETDPHRGLLLETPAGKSWFSASISTIVDHHLL
jgi:BirA family biotin operon repressor/biotin-[acetyl-CoA-carboxylase] ligase